MFFKSDLNQIKNKIWFLSTLFSRE